MRFTKGINQDVDPSAQPEGTYRDLVNGILNDKTGSIVKDRPTQSKSSFSNIEGTLTVPERNVIYVFEHGNGISSIAEYDYINDTTSSILSDTLNISNGSLDFGNSNITYLDASYSINNNDELILYWTDGVHPPRFYNVDKNKDIDDVYTLNMFPHYNSNKSDTPLFNFKELRDSGGSLSGGSYQLAFAYLDDDNTLTNYFYVTRPIRVYRQESQNNIFRYIGLDDETQTGKSIHFSISNLDTNYDRLRISAIKGTNVANIQDVSIPDTGTVDYTYTGNEDETAGSLDEIVIDSASYDSVNTITQHNNQMFMGGLEESGLSKSEKEELQKTALNTTVSITTNFTRPQSAGTGLDKITGQREGATFKRGEVYALYMSFIRDDGRETEAFHIPGRPPTNSLPSGASDKASYSNGGLTFNDRYKAIAEPDASTGMGYWENENESYPDKPPFNNETTTDVSGNTINFSEANIRHHRIPGPTYLYDSNGNNRTDMRPTRINSGNREANVVNLEVSNVDVPVGTPTALTDKIVGYKLYYAKKTDSDKLIIDQGSFNCGWVDAAGVGAGTDGHRPFQQDDNVFDNTKYCTHGFDELSEHDGDGDGTFTGEEWGAQEDVAYGRPVYSMINRPDVSGVTHIRGIEKIEYDHQPTISQYNLHNADGNRTKISGPHEGSEDDAWFIGVDSGPTYIEAGSREVPISEEYGFSHDMDNLFGESKIIMELNSEHMDRGFRMIFDMCVTQNNVHAPYDRQELVDTSTIGNIDSNGNGESLSFENGDSYITQNTYNANTLLSLLDGTKNNNDDSGWNDAFDKFWINDISDSLGIVGSSSSADLKGVRLGIQEVIGTEGDLNVTPFPVSHSYDSFVESRLPAGLVSDGEDSRYDLRAPRTDIGQTFAPWRIVPDVEDLEPSANEYDTSSSPPAREIIMSRIWADYFTRSDNYPQWNEEYAKVNTVKTAFPWDPFDIPENAQYNRIIRSSGDEDVGGSRSFRRFLSEDFLDVKENRGEVINLTELNDNLIIHTERSIIQTVGKERLKTTGGQEAFIGSGDIFRVIPEELNVTELGFAGLHSFRSQTSCEAGYFFVDKDANSIYWLSEGQGMNELTTEQLGLSGFFDDILRNPDKEPRVGYDSDSGRVMFTFHDTGNGDDKTISFYPDRPAWGSRHSYHPDRYVDILDSLATIKNNTLYFHEYGSSNEIYNNDSKFKFVYSVPHGFNHKVDHVWFNADNIDAPNGVINESIPFDTLSVENANQTTGNIVLTSYDGGSPEDITSRGNTRRTQGVWRVNDIRETGGGPGYLPSWAQDPRLEDDYHIVTLEKAASEESIILRSAGIDSEQTVH